MLVKARFTVLTAFIMLLAPLLSACGEPQITTQPTPVQPAQGATPGGGGVATTVNVDMTGIKYVPTAITVAAGSTVIWTNKEAPPHTVTEKGNAFDSGQMKKGDVFQRTFDTPGTVNYYCIVHGDGMSGTVTVTAASGGGGDPTQVPPTSAPTDSTATPAPAAPTSTVEAPTATVEAAQPTATRAAAQAAGNVRFKDDTQKTDKALITIDAVPARPAGKAQYAWLVNGATGASANLGRVTSDASGALKLEFSAPGNANILSLYDSFKLTNEALEVTPGAPSNDVVLSGALPPNALVHIRHLLVSFPATPNQIGLEVGLLGQVEIVRQHAEFLRDSQSQGNLAGVKLHAEHIVNIIEGAKGANYGDLNKDGKVTNPGDGYGLLQGGEQLGYLQGSKDHAELAATAADATADIKLHAGHVGIAADNVSGWVTTMRDKSLEALKAVDTAATAPLVAEILKLANQSRDGVDLKGDGQILPIPGSGGALTGYQHTQLMAAIPIAAGNVQTAPGGPVAPTVAVVATQPPAVANPTTGAQSGGAQASIPMKEFKFGSGPATVKVGTTITWVNEDTAPHTATADDNTFDSGNLQKGQSFSYTVKKAGEIKYFCALHGGPDGQGMASVIKVEP